MSFHSPSKLITLNQIWGFSICNKYVMQQYYIFMAVA